MGLKKKKPSDDWLLLPVSIFKKNELENGLPRWADLNWKKKKRLLVIAVKGNDRRGFEKKKKKRGVDRPEAEKRVKTAQQ